MCLMLPIKDGTVPTFLQVEKFLHHATDTIKKGKKVVVYCHAGVGRTGTFLAIYLMNKYKMDANTALKQLRSERPQSLQYNLNDWSVDPFKIRDPEIYERNLLQERYLQFYYEQVILKGALILSSNPICSSSDTLNNYIEPCQYDDNLSSEEYFVKSGFSLEEVDFELSMVLEEMNLGRDESFEVKEESICYICKRILSIGPALISNNSMWPPGEAEITYFTRNKK